MLLRQEKKYLYLEIPFYLQRFPCRSCVPPINLGKCWKGPLKRWCMCAREIMYLLTSVAYCALSAVTRAQHEPEHITEAKRQLIVFKVCHCSCTVNSVNNLYRKIPIIILWEVDECEDYILFLPSAVPVNVISNGMWCLCVCGFFACPVLYSTL